MLRAKLFVSLLVLLSIMICECYAGRGVRIGGGFNYGSGNRNYGGAVRLDRGVNVAHGSRDYYYNSNSDNLESSNPGTSYWYSLVPKHEYDVGCSLWFSAGVLPGLLCSFSASALGRDYRDKGEADERREFSMPWNFLDQEETDVVGKALPIMAAPFVDDINLSLGKINNFLNTNEPCAREGKSCWTDRVCGAEFGSPHFYAPIPKTTSVRKCKALMPILNHAFVPVQNTNASPTSVKKKPLLSVMMDPSLKPTIPTIFMNWSRYIEQDQLKQKDNSKVSVTGIARHYEEVFSQSLFSADLRNSFPDQKEFFLDAPKENLGQFFDPFFKVEQLVDPAVTPTTSIAPRILKALWHEYSVQYKGIDSVRPHETCDVAFPIDKVDASQWPRMLHSYVITQGKTTQDTTKQSTTKPEHQCHEQALAFQGAYLQQNPDDVKLFNLLSADKPLTSEHSTEARLINNLKTLDKLKSVLRIPGRIAFLKKRIKKPIDPDSVKKDKETIKDLKEEFENAKGKAFILNQGIDGNKIFKITSKGDNVTQLTQEVIDEDLLLRARIYTMRMPFYAEIFTEENCQRDPKYMFFLLGDPFASDSLKSRCIRNHGNLPAKVQVFEEQAEEAEAQTEEHTDVGPDGRVPSEIESKAEMVAAPAA